MGLPMKLKTPASKKLEMIVPKRLDVKWEKEKGVVIITFKKNFTRFEKFLQKFLKGPENIRLRMDKHGTDIWELCDGKHSAKDICDAMNAKYKEEMEPVPQRVSGFLQILLQRQLIRLERKNEKENQEV
jgi:hypothetical protein